MTLSLKLKNEILNLLSSNDKSALIIIGKIGKNTSIEIMKIIKSLEDEQEKCKFNLFRTFFDVEKFRK